MTIASLSDAQVAALKADGWEIKHAWDAAQRASTWTLRSAAQHLEIDDATASSMADDAIARQAAEATAASWVKLRAIRDRWLAETDYIEVRLAGGFSPLPAPVGNAIATNKQAWLAWRQALRDLPAQAGLDPAAAVAAAATVHATTDTFPSPWPQPPDAPVIHLT